MFEGLVRPAGKFLIVLLWAALPLSSCSASTTELSLPEGDRVAVEPWVEGLEIPWSLVFLPGGRALVSERPGRIRLIEKGVLAKEPYAVINVAHTGEAGLMGLAVHPQFPKMPYIYAMHTYEKGGKLFNRVIRLKDRGEAGVFDRVIIDDIPGGRFHDGGRIAFGPDGMLYVATGETFSASMAQDLGRLGGKILRVTPGGDIPPDNPFKGSPVYSYGHRNPQGLAWNAEGALFASEHGPSGEFLRFGNDEVNVVLKGGNYGWPEVIGRSDKKGFVNPVVLWEKATPPSGITFYKGDLLAHLKGDLFVATLASRALIRVRFSRDNGAYRAVRMERWFTDRYGRLRDVVEGPDGALYFLTNNRDGRGEPRPGDDRIYRVVPGK